MASAEEERQRRAEYDAWLKSNSVIAADYRGDVGLDWTHHDHARCGPGDGAEGPVGGFCAGNGEGSR